MKVLRITMPDGSQWDVMADRIAHERAAHYANIETGKTSGKKHTDIYKREMAYTLENDDELMDWAANNMNWEDVQSCARMHKAGTVDYQEGWINGEKQVVAYTES